MTNDANNSKELPIWELLRCFPVSTRLSNNIKAAIHDGCLPYHSVGDYLRAGPEAINAFLKLPNMGRKSAWELDQLIRLNFKFEPLPEIPNCTNHSLAISIPDLIKVSIVSRRLENAINQINLEGNCPYPSIKDYLEAGTTAKQFFRDCPNIGKKTAQELDDLIRSTDNAFLITDEQENQANSLKQVRNPNNLLSKIDEVLSDKEQFILRSRLIDSLTLQSTADVIGVTRERVRQIEAKAHRKLRTILHKNCDQLISVIEQFLLERGFAANIDSFAQNNDISFEQAHLTIKIINNVNPKFEDIYGIWERHFYLLDNFLDEFEWDVRISDAVYESNWPMELNEFLQDVANVPPFYVSYYLTETLDAEIVDGKINKISKLGMSEMCIKVLKQEQRPLHTSEMRSRLLALFDKQSSEHAIGSTLGRLEEALIVGPGTYALYEHIPLSQNDLERIKDLVFKFLLDKGKFISTKIIFQTLFSKRLSEFPDFLNDYVILGIAQDDDRFLSKRGNMLGLSSFEILETFTSLEDEVLAIVEARGPISTNEIMHHLSESRRLCNDSGVRLILETTPKIIAVGKKVYDLISRYFESETDYENLKTALTVILLPGEKSIFTISSELAQLGFQKHEFETIDSVLKGIKVTKDNLGSFSLQINSADLNNYNQIVNMHMDKDMEYLSQELYRLMPMALADKYLSFDLRLKNHNKGISSIETHSEISSLLSDFGI